VINGYPTLEKGLSIVNNSDLLELRWEDEDPLRFNRKHFDQFLQWCFENSANDVIIESGEVLGAKIDGEVWNVGRKKIRYEEISEILRQIYTPAAPTLLTTGKDIKFPYSILIDDDKVIRFRGIATSNQGTGGARNGTNIVLRTIPGVVPICEDLEMEQEIIDACNAKYGIILVTGPTGSGKSTTIAALLRHKAVTTRSHIITYESPIEFDLKTIPNRKSRVIQSEVPINLENYRLATTNSLRRAPDVILFGEASDQETISACIRESQTGHLVFSTVHTNNVAMTIARMADEFDKSERKGATSKLVDAMRMIVHQRLVKKLGGGRIALREYLVFTDKMRRKLLMSLLEKDDLGTDIYTLLEGHGKSLLQDAREKLTEGLIPLSEYTSVVTEVGSPSDMLGVSEIIKNLLEKGIIDNYTHDAWSNDLLGSVE